MATVSVTCPNLDEGATGPSQLGTGDIARMQSSASTQEFTLNFPIACNPIRAYVSLDSCNAHNKNVALGRCAGQPHRIHAERTARVGEPNGITILLLYPVIASNSASSVWVVQTGNAKLLRNAWDEVNR